MGIREMNNFDGPEREVGPEVEKYSSHILLHFTRHGEKGKDPEKTNAEQLLTPKGKRQALEKGAARGGDHHTAMAYGSHVVRSQEVAGYEMAAAQGITDITGDETLDELKEKLDAGLRYGHRLGMDKRLGFDFHDKEYERIKDEAYAQGRGLEFFVKESDALAEKLGDHDSTTYTRTSAKVARVMEKYLSIAPRFHEIISDSEKRNQYGDTMERFMGSHAGVIDCFLCKVVEKMKGVAERDKLIETLGKQGFDETEGFEASIDQVPDQDKPQWHLRIQYSKKDPEGKELFSFNEVVPQEVLMEIIQEGETKELEQ